MVSRPAAHPAQLAPTWARSFWPGPSESGAGARESQSGAAAEKPAWGRAVSPRV